MSNVEPMVARFAAAITPHHLGGKCVAL